MSKKNNTPKVSQKMLKAVKTTRPSTNELNRVWYIADASKEPLGRLATKIARVLIGKNLANYSQDVDMGGVVVVINVEKLVLSGKKSLWKTYFTHTGRPGRLFSKNLKEVLVTTPKRPVYQAVKGMLPKNSQQSERLNHRLKLIVGKEHKFTQEMIPLN